MNNHAIGCMLDVFLKIISLILQQMEKLSKEFDEGLTKDFLICTGRLEMAEMILYSAILSDPNDFMYQSPESDDWQLLNQIVTEIPLANKKKYKKEITSTIESVQLGGAFVSKGLEKENAFVRFIYTASQASYFALAKKNRSQQYELFMNNPRPSHIKELSGMEDGTMAKNVYKLLIPSINIVEKLYLPMLHEGLTEENCGLFDINRPREDWWKKEGEGIASQMNHSKPTSKQLY
jgi:hypothetical protein